MRSAISARKLLGSVLLFVTLGAAAYQWGNVQLLAGGYVPGAEFHPAVSGLAYLRTDIGGAYRMIPGASSSWLPLNDGFGEGGDMGSIAVGLDPAVPNALYLTAGLYTNLDWCGAGSFLRSADRGQTWTKIPLNATTVQGTAAAQLNGTGGLCLGGNDVGRGMGNRMVVRGNNIWLGTNQNGLIRSTDLGNTWTTVASLDNTQGIGAVVVDHAGHVYAAPYAGGVWKSTDGLTFTQLPAMTAAVYQMVYSPADSSLYMTTNATNPLDQGNAGGGAVRKFHIASASFSQLTLPPKGSKDYGYTGIAVSPQSAGTLVVSTGGWWKGNHSPNQAGFVPHEAIFLTKDGGATWKDILGEGEFDAASAYNHAASNPHWQSALAMNPFDPDHVIFGTGYGIWETKTAGRAQPTWIFANQGIEETAPLALVSTTAGAPLVSALGDIDGFWHGDLNVPPSNRHKTGNGTSEAGTNYDMDFAQAHQNFLVRVHKEAAYKLGGYSIDGGRTWNDFGSHPPFVASQGSATYSNEDNFMAVSADAASIVWNMATHGVYRSLDSGRTWTASATSAANLAGYRVLSDRVDAGTYYIYNGGTGVLYRSTDHGATWQVRNSALERDDEWARPYFRIFVSPDRAGELWITQGAHIYNCYGESWCTWPEYQGGGLWIGQVGEDNVVLRSLDGGATVTPVNGLTYATYVGFGKGLNTGSAIYVVGMDALGVEGVFRSTNEGNTWARINDDAHRFGGITMVVGDPCIYSRVYVTGAGRGIIYGQEGSPANTCALRVDQEISTGITRRTLGQNTNLTYDALGQFALSAASIRLHRLDGVRVAQAQPQGGQARLELRGRPQGVYVLSSGGRSMQILLP